MKISNSYSAIARIVNHINNPNYATGTLIEEIPTDIGRSYEGYKRGGVLEGAEKMRKEVMCALVWLFGIPAFNKAGNLFCEKILKIPVGIDFSNSKKGNAAIENSIKYLKGDESIAKNFDVSEIVHYKETLADKLKNTDTKTLVNQVSVAKQVTSIAAVILNCLVMGVVLPKYNQYLTNKKIEKAKKQEISLLKPKSFDEFTQKQKNNVSFKGGISDKLQNISSTVTYKTENDNVFRLVVVDIPMIIGRCITSRNKYEALEYVVMDGASIYFYNFLAKHVQQLLRKTTDTPNINPKTAEYIGQLKKNDIETALNNIKVGKKINLEELFNNKEIATEIYKQGTYGKYGMVNRFVKDDDLKEIDENVITFLNKILKMSSDTMPIFKNGELNKELLGKAIGKINKSNALYLALGLGCSIFGLAVLIPKLTFFITKKITGKDTFIGIENFDNEKKES